MVTNCPCGSQQPYTDCCGRLHEGLPAATPEALMRSRYSAYALGRIDYLITSTLPAQQAGLDRQAMREWSAQSQWLGLSVERADAATDAFGHAKVSFRFRWEDCDGQHEHREHSIFVQRGKRWYFIDPGIPLQAGRNDPCPCGSGGKFKKCCAGYF